MDGSMKMRCTATAFSHEGRIYQFVSAAHCVASDDTTHEKVDVDKTRFFITFDESKEKKFHSAKLLMAGYQHKGDDFSVFSVESDENWPTIPLGDDTPEKVGSPVINIASPGGLGKQLFHGYISSKMLDRPIVEEDINWTGVMMVQIEIGPGSSGSSVISESQGAIVAFLVGTARDNPVAMPVSRFKAFLTAIEGGKYKWFHADDVAQ
jgi:S1-C subfamily serine protease